MESLITFVVGGNNSVGCLPWLLFSFLFFIGSDIDIDINIDKETVDDDFVRMKLLSYSDINDSKAEVENVSDFVDNMILLL